MVMVMTSDSRRAEDSLCCDHVIRPRDFHGLAVDGVPVFENEIRSVIEGRLHFANDCAYAEGRLLSLVRRAALGRLKPYRRPPDFSPFRHRSAIWELRFIDFKSGEQFRLFYSEEQRRDPPFVALRFVWKDTHVRGPERNHRKVERLMDAVSEDAARLLAEYADIQWGHRICGSGDGTPSSCEFCLQTKSNLG